AMRPAHKAALGKRHRRSANPRSSRKRLTLKWEKSRKGKSSDAGRASVAIRTRYGAEALASGAELPPSALFRASYPSASEKRRSDAAAIAALERKKRSALRCRSRGRFLSPAWKAITEASG